MVEVGPDAFRVICSTCVSGGARLPPREIDPEIYNPAKSRDEILKEGMTFD